MLKLYETKKDSKTGSVAELPVFCRKGIAASASVFFRDCGFTWNADLALPASVPRGVFFFHEVQVFRAENMIFALFQGDGACGTLRGTFTAQGAVPVQILGNDIVGSHGEGGDHASEPPGDTSGCNESPGEAEGTETADKGHMPF
jgi:hypothetical protein